VDLHSFLSETIVGIVEGSTFVLIALGFSLIYGALGLINFAQISIYTVGGFTLWEVLKLFQQGASPSLWVYAVGILIAAGIGGLVGASVAGVTWLPLRRRSPLSLLVASLAVLVLIENLLLVLVSPSPVSVADPLQATAFTLAGVDVTESDVLLMVAGIVLSVVTVVLIQKSRFGWQVRAIADDNVSAELIGIDVRKVVFIAFAIAAGLAAIAGALISSNYGVVSYDVGITIGLKGFTAAVLGGMGNLWGALVGGLALGLIAAYSLLFLPSQWEDAVVFAVLILVLALRPTGILSTVSTDRA